MADRFDAFISYSRAASASLAIDLQLGIERFAKPWYRLRASRVFRDDSSMSANTSLWATIEGGLTDAGWLILIATPEAASSEYVDQEIAWWIAHKGASTILLVHAGGELSWDRVAGTFSASTDSVPLSLRTAYAQEPRWIDMRWYSAPDSLGKADTRFVERVADLTAAVRGAERDELVGENVRQHRRALTFLRTGIAALAGLLVVSLVATVIAVAQGSEAARQRDAAETQARIATARQLAATSLSLQGSNATVAKLLAVYAYQLNADPQTQAALLAAVSTQSGDTSLSIDVGEPVTALGGASDGSVVILGTDSGRILEWTPGQGDPTELGSLPGKIATLSTSADGNVVGATAQYLDENGQFFLTDTGLWIDGAEVELPVEAMPPLAVSPSGDTVGFEVELPDDHVSPGFDADSGFEFLRRDTGFEAVSDALVFSPGAYEFALPSDDEVVAWVGTEEGGQVQRRTLDGFDVITDAQTPGGVPRDHVGQLSPTGEYIVQVDRNSSFDGATENEIPIYSTAQDTESPTLLGYALNTSVEAIAMTGDASRFATAAAGVIYVSRPREASATYTEPLVLTGSVSILALDFLNPDTLVSSSGTAATLRRLGGGNPLQTDVSFSSANTDGAAHDLPLRLNLNDDGSRLVTLEQGYFSGEIDQAEGNSSWRTVGADEPVLVAGVPLAWKSNTEAFLLSEAGLGLYDAESGELTDLTADIPFTLTDLNLVEDAVSLDQARYRADSNALRVATPTEIVELDGSTGAVRTSWPLPGARLSPDGRYAVTSTEDAGSYSSTVTDLESGSVTDVPGVGIAPAEFRGPYVAVIESRETAALWNAQGTESFGSFPNPFTGPLAVSEDGSLAASYSIDGVVSVISVLTGQVLGRFDIHGSSFENSGVAFSGDGTVLVGSHSSFGGGSYSIIDLDPANWVDAVCSSAGRDLTATEWKRYTGQPLPDGLGCST